MAGFAALGAHSEAGKRCRVSAQAVSIHEKPFGADVAHVNALNCL